MVVIYDPHLKSCFNIMCSPPSLRLYQTLEQFGLIGETLGKLNMMKLS